MKENVNDRLLHNTLLKITKPLSKTIFTKIIYKKKTKDLRRLTTSLRSRILFGIGPSYPSRRSESRSFGLPICVAQQRIEIEQNMTLLKIAAPAARCRSRCIFKQQASRRHA